MTRAEQLRQYERLAIQHTADALTKNELEEQILEDLRESAETARLICSIFATATPAQEAGR